MELQPNDLLKALQFCLSSEFSQMKEGQDYLNTARKCKNYSSSLLQIASNFNIAKEIQQIASIQIKNFVTKFWIQGLDRDENQIIISNQEKEKIKSSILKIIPNLSNRCRKLFLQSVKFILKFDSDWKDLIPTILSYLNCGNNLIFLCGVEIFYQMSCQYEFEIETRREIYNNTFNAVETYLEKFIDDYLHKLSGVNFQSVDLRREKDYFELRILHKILKIFFRSIQMNLPSALIQNKGAQFQKWMNSCCFLAKLNFEQLSNDSLSLLNKIPQNLDELQFLRKNILWKIKYTSINVIYKIYEKYSDPSKIGKKEKLLKEFATVIENNYSEFFFSVFYETLSQSKERYLQEEIICLIYQFFHLILNRANSNQAMLQLLHVNLEKIIKDYLIFNNIIGQMELDAIKSNHQDYIYRQFETGLEYDSKRVAITKFLIRLTEYKVKKKSPGLYAETVYSYLISSLQYIDVELHNNNCNDNLFFVLLKESLLNLIGSLNHVIADYYQDEIENVIAKHVLNDLQAISSYWLIQRDAAIAFIERVSQTINLKNVELINLICDCILQNLFNCNLAENLMIPVRSALVIPSLINTHPIVKDIFKPQIANIISVFLKLIQILDLDELIKCLEKLVSAYKDEVIEFSVELTRELINSLDRYIRDENGADNKEDLYEPNREENSLDDDLDDFSSSSENVNTNSAFSFVLKTINKLILVAAKKESYDIFYQIESLTYPILTWVLKSNDNMLFKEIIDIIYSIVSSQIPISNLMWSLYSDIINTLIVHQDTSQITYEPGLGFDHLQEIITIILNYIVKDPNSFLQKDGFQFISLTMNIIPQIIVISRRGNNIDEVGCSYAIKIFIILLETYKEKLDFLLRDILSFVISELKGATQNVYKSILFQTIALSYVYNPRMTNQILEEMNIVTHLFELWINMISQMKFDFEYRRTLMAFASLLLIDRSEVNKIIIENIGFIINKIIYISKKLDEIKEKRKEKEEVEVSGDEESDCEEKEFEMKSKTKNFKRQLKDFIVDDLEDEDDIDDEDYNELENSFEDDGQRFKTNLDAQDEFIYVRDVLNYLNESNADYYNHLMSLMSDKDKQQLSGYIYKAEIRMAGNGNNK